MNSRRVFIAAALVFVLFILFFLGGKISGNFLFDFLFGKNKETHFICRSLSCIEVPSSVKGKSCLGDSDCADFRSVCEDNSCVLKKFKKGSVKKPDECRSDKDCSYACRRNDRPANSYNNPFSCGDCSGVGTACEGKAVGNSCTAAGKTGKCVFLELCTKSDAYEGKCGSKCECRIGIKDAFNPDSIGEFRTE